MKKHLIYVAVSSSLALTGCGSSSDSNTSKIVDSSETSEQTIDQSTNDVAVGNKEGQEGVDVFALENVLDINIEMNEDDWRAMSFEGPTPSNFHTACVFEGYNYFNATVTIDNEKIENVAIRKKGFIGSLSSLKPSIKLNYGKGDEYDGRTFNGRKRFILNNNIQDPADIKQCLSYEIFSRAGVASPRCNFAKVTAQGKNLGTYTHVEAIKKPFLASAFGDDSGNLYEISRDGDFNTERLDYIDAKTNEKANDRSDLSAILAALELDDAILWQELDKLINLEQFINFAAVEALVGHTDGYTGFQNNVYLYKNPSDQRFYFIPWGTDQSFRETHVYGAPVPSSVLLGSELMVRLWQLPEFQQQYDQRMLELLDTIWHEDQLVSLANKMAEVVDADNVELEGIHHFINTRRDLISSEINSDLDREWSHFLLGDVDGCPVQTPVTVSFDLVWGEQTPSPNLGFYSINVDLEEAPLSFSEVDEGASFGAGNWGWWGDKYIINMSASFSDVNSEAPINMGLSLMVPPELWKVGEVPFHMFETVGQTFQSDGAFGGWITDGRIIFEEVSTEPGGRVAGKVTGLITP